MKHLYFFLFVFILGGLSSCSDEDDYKKLDNQVNTVTFKVYSNSPGVPVTLTDCCPGPYLIIKNSWERTVSTMDYVAQIEAECEDKNTLITGEIYINGRLKRRSESNRFLKFAVPIKGNPPFRFY